MRALTTYLLLTASTVLFPIHSTQAQGSANPSPGQEQPKDSNVNPVEIVPDTQPPCEFFPLGQPNNCTEQDQPVPKDLRLDSLQMIFFANDLANGTEAACDFSSLEDKPTIAKIEQIEQEHPYFGCAGEPLDECGIVDPALQEFTVNCSVPQTFCEQTLGGKYVYYDLFGPCELKF